MEGTMKNKNDLWAYLGIALGVVAIIAGLVFLFAFKNETFLGAYAQLGATEFGGDFYTYSYRASAFAANAVAGVYEMLSTCFGCLFILLGALDICFFGSRISVKSKESTDESTEVKAE